MKKLYVLLLLFSVLGIYRVAAQTTYEVTEEQLQKLDQIYQSYKANNQTAQQQQNELLIQVQNLQNKAQKLQTESETLKQQLQKERTSTARLNESLKRYEINEALREEKILELTQTITEKEVKIGKLKTTCVTLTATIIVVLLGMAVWIYIRFKRPADR